MDEHSSLMDALGLEAFLINTGLQSLVQEFIEGQTEHVIELEFFIGEKTISVHSVEKGGSFEKSAGVFFFKSKQFSGCFSELGEHEMHSPDFSLVLETVLADKLQFVVDSFLFEGSSGSVEGGGV